MYAYRFLIIVVFLLAGCQTAGPPMSSEENVADVQSALGSIAGAVSSAEQLTAAELKALEKQIRQDPEARSAVETITNSMDPKERTVRYCPVTGKRYAPRVKVCPVHKVELLEVE